MDIQRKKKKGGKKWRKEEKPHRKEEKGVGQTLKRQITEHREVSENVIKEKSYLGGPHAAGQKARGLNVLFFYF